MIFRMITTAAALALSAAAIAQAPATTTPTPAPGHVRIATQTTASTTISKPAIGAAKVTRRKRVTSTAAATTPMGRVVAVKTSTGKTIHYDCGKPGNKNKVACKG